MEADVREASLGLIDSSGVTGDLRCQSPHEIQPACDLRQASLPSRSTNVLQAWALNRHQRSVVAVLWMARYERR